MAVEGDDDRSLGMPSFLRRAFENAPVGLMRHEPVDVLGPVTPAASMVSCHHVAILTTACLNTSLPSMRKWPTVLVRGRPAIDIELVASSGHRSGGARR